MKMYCIEHEEFVEVITPAGPLAKYSIPYHYDEYVHPDDWIEPTSLNTCEGPFAACPPPAQPIFNESGELYVPELEEMEVHHIE